MGFPIRKSLDQSLFAAPQGLSQRTTSFIASQRQGIHRMPLIHLITLMIDVRPIDPLSRAMNGIIRKTIPPDQQAALSGSPDRTSCRTYPNSGVVKRRPCSLRLQGETKAIGYVASSR